MPSFPKRKGKRQTNKLSFALTSNYCLENMEEKITKTQEEDTAKEETMRSMEEKRTQKDTFRNKCQKKESKINPKAANKFTKKSCEASERVFCDHCLSPIKRRIIDCSHCKKRFNFNCIPSSHRLHILDDDDNDPFML